MRKGPRASSSSDSEENQKPWSKDSSDASSPRVYSSAEGSSSDYDVEDESAMKRSQRFSSSSSLEEDQQLKSKDGGEELLPKNSGLAITELLETDLVEERARLEQRDVCDDNKEPPRSAAFRPQELWLAVTRCLSLRWPPCLSISRLSNRKLAYQVEHDQSEDTQSSVSSDSTNGSSSSTCTPDDRDRTLVKHEDDPSRGFKSVQPPRRGVSRSSPRLPRARQAADSTLAARILEKEMFLRIELVDSGEERDDLRYRAEWKLSERTQELAEGVWLSRNLKMTR